MNIWTDPVEVHRDFQRDHRDPIGGIKVIARSGWFAARPSGTEDVYKLYAESFRGDGHLRQIQEQARAVIQRILRAVR
jgi:phosphoglucomutase